MDIRGNFHAHSSPSPEYNQTPRKTAGKELFDHISEFYFWYVSWDISPYEHTLTYECFSRIMRIAHVSMNGGNYMRESEEKNAILSAVLLQEKLFDGTLRQNEMPRVLLQIIRALTENNPKAKLIGHVTELEYRFCINPKQKYSPEHMEDFKKTLNYIVDQVQVNTDFPEIHAQAVAQGLLQILEANSTKTLPSLREAMKGWM